MIGGSIVSAQANLLVNGSFETGDFTGWSFTGNTGYTSVQSTYAYGPEDGSYYVYAGPIGSDGYLSQTFNDTPGQLLEISGWVTNDGSSPSDFGMSFDGVQGVELNPVPAMGWTEYSFTATATGLDTFAANFRNDPDYIGMDNFQVNAVPEPAPMLALGLGAAVFIRRRKKA